MKGRYTFEEGTSSGLTFVRLFDRGTGSEVTVFPKLGHTITSFIHNKQELLYFPFDPKDYSENKSLAGIPFLYPFANRLNRKGFYFKDQFYEFEGEIFRDQFSNPLHGFLLKEKAWDLTSIDESIDGIQLTSRLNFNEQLECFRNFPFSHSIEMGIELKNGNLSISLKVTNSGNKDLPLGLGFHPYFKIPFEDRNKTILHLPSNFEISLDKNLIPDGRLIPISKNEPIFLKDVSLDTGYTDLERDEYGFAHFVTIHREFRTEILFGRQYKTAMVYTPLGEDYICIEPMLNPTNSWNSPGIDWMSFPILSPGEEFSEVFQIKPKTAVQSLENR